LLHAAASAIYTPNSLSQKLGLRLGPKARETRLTEVFEQTGRAIRRSRADSGRAVAVDHGGHEGLLVSVELSFPRGNKCRGVRLWRH
jgi:hypothetical protein